MLAQSVRRKALVLLAIVGVLNTHVPSKAESPAPVGHRPKVPDVRMDSEHRFHGMLVNGQGQPLAGARVKLIRQESGERVEKSTLDVTTGSDGRFTIATLLAGTYRVEVSSGVYLFRLWTHKAAPPAAAPSLLVVDDAQIRRGQRPIGDMLHADPIFIATVVAAAIAIPIIVHKGRGDRPEGS